MLSNYQFLEKIQTSFKEFIKCKTSRSTAKLKPLHGAIAQDIAKRLGDEYKIWSQGYAEGKEKKINGRYIDKNVDITIVNIQTERPVAGIAIKFVMQNYSQNSNNYFENMLGETANIRTTNCPYFQIFIILDKLPYYQNNGTIKKWEKITEHNMQKYSVLAKDNIEQFMHTPNKTLIYVVHVSPDISEETKTKEEYMNYYNKHKNKLCIKESENEYKELKKGGNIIFNNYKSFMDKIYHTIKSI